MSNTLRYLARGARGKLLSAITGRAPPHFMCQIPDVRMRYTEMGLAPRKGFFVEVGGYDGHEYSNTAFLADQGWRGLYIEPIPAFCRLIRQRHFLNKVSIEPVAVGLEPGTKTIQVMGPLSTMQDPVHAAYTSIPWSKTAAQKSVPVTIKVDRLREILQRNHVPATFDLMVVDTEGSEEEIVRALFSTVWKPRVLIVELCDQHSDFDQSPDLQSSHRRTRELVLANGYRQHWADRINTIFSIGK